MFMELDWIHLTKSMLTGSSQELSESYLVNVVRHRSIYCAQFFLLIKALLVRWRQRSKNRPARLSIHFEKHHLDYRAGL